MLYYFKINNNSLNREWLDFNILEFHYVFFIVSVTAYGETFFFILSNYLNSQNRLNEFENGRFDLIEESSFSAYKPGRGSKT